MKVLANTIENLDPQELSGMHLHRYAGINLDEPRLVEQVRQTQDGYRITIWVDSEMIDIIVNPQTRVIFQGMI